MDAEEVLHEFIYIGVAGFNLTTVTVQNLPPCSPFLNPIEDFFSAWWWKVYDLRPYVQMALIQAMEEACDQIEAASILLRYTGIQERGDEDCDKRGI